MANGGRIDYTIGFKVDKTGLNDVYKSLAKLQSAQPGDLLNRNFTSGKQLAQATAQLDAAKKAAAAIGPALQNSFNTRLNVINVKQFNEEINKTYGSVKNLFAALNDGGAAGQQAAAQLSRTLLTTQTNIQKTETFLDKMGTTFMNTIKWTISSSVIKKITGTFAQAIGYVEHLDSSLNDIRIVTKKSADEMDAFAAHANSAAQSLGKATTDYTEASLIYYQQGLSDEEVKARTETTLKAANVTGQATATVAEQLTAVWNGFRVNAEQTEEYVDKLAAVAATTASNLEELSTGMSKVASAAANLGIDIDQLTAQISTIVSVTRQAPESVGTALKTIYARISDLKLGETDEDGLGLGDVSGGLEKLGIHVLDSEGELRDLGVVIEEVAAKWKTWTSAQQAAIAQLMAGKRQYNNLVALFSNWDMYTSAIETSRNATGELQKQQDIYMESTETHIQQLKTKWEDLYDSLIDADTINSFAKIMTNIVSGVTKFVDTIGGGSGVLTHFIGLFTTLFSGKIASSINEMIQRFSDNKAIDNLIKARQAMSVDMYNANGQSTASNETASAYSKWIKYADVMSNAQREQATYLTNNISKLGEEVDARREDIRVIDQQIDAEQKRKVAIEAAADQARFDFEEQQRQAAKTVKDLEANLGANNAPYSRNAPYGRFGADYSKGYTPDELVAEWSSTDENIIKIKDDIDNVIRSSEIASKSIQKFFNQEPAKTQVDSDGKQTWAEQDFDKWSSQGVEAIRSVQDQMKNLRDAGQLTKEEFERLQGVFKNAFTTGPDGIAQLNKSTLPATQQALREIQQLANETGEKFKQVKGTLEGTFDVDKFLASQPSLDKIDEKIAELNRKRQEGEAIEQKTIEALEQQRQILIDQNKIYARQQTIQNITKTLSGVLQLANSVRTVSNLTKNLVSGKGGIGDLFSGLTSSALTTVMTVKSLKDVLGSFKGSSNSFLNSIGSFFGTGKGTLALSGISIGIQAVTAAFSVYQGILEKNAEKARELAESNQKYVDTLTEENNKITELSDAYKDLLDAREDGINFTEEQKEKVNDLIKEYGDEHLRVLLLTGDYEALGKAIEQARAGASQKTVEGLQNSKQLYTDSIIADVKAKRGWTEVDSEGFDFTDAELDRYEEWRNDLAEVIGKTGEEAEEFKNYIISSGGHVQWEDLVEILTADSTKLYEFLQKYKGEDNTNQIRELLSQNNQQIENYKTTLDETKRLSLEVAGFNFVDENQDSIKDAESFNQAVEELAKAQESLFKDEDDPAQAAKAWARDFLTGVSEEFQNYGDSLLIGDEIIKQMGSKLSKEQEASLKQQLSEMTDAERSYVASMTSMFAHLIDQGDDVDKVFNKVKSRLASLQKEDHVVKITTILNETSKKKFKEEVEELFSDDSFDIGLSPESFLSLDEGLQRVVLTSQKLKENLGKQEISEEVKEENARNLTQLEQGLSEYTTKLQEAQDENDALITQHNQYMNTLIEGIANVDEDSKQKYQENSEEFTEQIKSDLEKISQWYEESGGDVDKFNEIFQKGTETNGELSEEFIKYLDLDAGAGGRTADQIMRMAKSFKTHDERLKSANKNLKNYSDQIEHYTNDIKALKDADPDNIDWEGALQDTKEAISEFNKVVDGLQNSYQALQGVVEDYNEDGYLTLDNLQKLMEMDSAYVATLQLEDNQLSINDQAYQGLLQSTLDIMEAKATEQYIEELNTIAKKDNVNASQALDVANANNVDTINQVINAAKAGAAALWEYAGAKKAAEVDSSATEQATTAYKNRLKMIENMRNQSVNRVLGKSSSSKSSSGSKESKPKTEKELEREEDIYRQINTELENIESTLKRIQTIDEHSWGESQKKALQEEQKLLDKQIATLERKQKMQVGDLSTRRKQLEDVGVTFSSDGSVMTNAESVLNQLYAGYNQMVQRYNNMSAAEQDAYKAQMDTEKNRIDAIEKAIGEYESGYSDLQGTLDELQSKHYEQIETNVREFNHDIDVHLELSDAKKEWNDFWEEVVEDVDDNDFGKKIAGSMKQLENLVGLGGSDSGIVGELTNHLTETVDMVQAQLAAASSGGAGLFEDDTAASHDNLVKYRDELMSALRDAKDEVDEIRENYFNMLDEAQEKMDKQKKGWENIRKQLEHNANLIKLIDGENAYDALNKQYELRHKNNLETIETNKQSAEWWKQRMENAKRVLETTDKNSQEWKDASKEYEVASENYIKNLDDFNQSVEQALEDINEQIELLTNQTFDKLEKSLTKGLGFDVLEEEWKLINDYANSYFDNVERYLNMEEYTNTLNDAANAIGLSAENQQKLNEFRDQELDKLRAKEKLTSYDIEESKARLEIMKAQMALEDAQRNKSNLRLRRDSQGNYNYQYVENADAVEEADQGAFSARKEWYEIVKNQNLHLTEELMNDRKALFDYEKKANEAWQAGNIEAYNKYRELAARTFDQIQFLQGEVEKNKQDLYAGTAQYFAEVDNANIIPQNEATVRTLIDNWASGGEDSFIGAVTLATNRLSEINEEYGTKTKEVLDKAGIDYQKLRDTGLDPTIDTLQTLVDTNEDFKDMLDETSDSLAEQERNLRDAENAYDDLKDAAVGAIEAANNALNQLATTAVSAVTQVTAAINAAKQASAITYNTAIPSSSGSGGGSGTGGGGYSSNATSLDSQSGQYILTAYTDTGFTVTGYPKTFNSEFDMKKQAKIAARNYSISMQKPNGNIALVNKHSHPTPQAREYAIQAFRSGGYTGSWNDDSGRWAVLHQKELVLNASDTKNMLSAVEILRSLPIEALAKSIITSSSNIASSFASGVNVSGIAGGVTNNDSKNMVINADFSGVSSADEIYKAFLSLENYGIQQSYSVIPNIN